MSSSIRNVQRRADRAPRRKLTPVPATPPIDMEKVKRVGGMSDAPRPSGKRRINAGMLALLAMTMSMPE